MEKVGVARGRTDCLVRIETCSQFHQYFMNSFYADILSQKITKPNCNYRKTAQILYKKFAHKMLMNLTPGFHVGVTTAGAARTIIGKVVQTSTTMAMSFFIFLRFFSTVSVAAVIVVTTWTSAVSVFFVAVDLLLHLFAVLAKTSEAFIFR